MTAMQHPWPYPRIIAHRGGGAAAPENTLAAMRTGARHGFGMVEFDVKLSHDGVPILLHDDTVERTSNGHGKACELAWHELARLDFGRWYSPDYAGESMATLYSVAAFTQANHIYSNIEIKPSPGAESQTGMQIALFAAQLWSNPAAPPLLSSFSETALQAAMQAAPYLPRALLLDGRIPQDWEARMQRHQCIALNIDHAYATPGLIREAHAKGYRIAAWTVNEPVRARELLDWGCDAIFTDAITLITPDF